MPSGERWPGILALMSPETRFFGLIALLAEAALIAVTAALPSGQRIYAFGAFLALLLLMIIGTMIVVSRSKSHDHNQPLKIKVKSLKAELVDHRFLPQLIIGVARGGLAVAGTLSREFGEKHVIPVIALTRRGGPGEFRNSFNALHFTRTDFADDTPGQPVNVLIVDDISVSGHTLAAAKAYVEAAIDDNDFRVETAALSFYAQSNSIEPRFYVDTPRNPIRDSSGEEEQPTE